MKRPSWKILTVLVGTVACATGVAAWVNENRATDPLPELPTESTSAWDLLYAQPFRVDEPYTHYWRAERPTVSAGHVLVLAVDPNVVVPRNSAEPVLFVGDQTAERVNHGHLDGALVVIVPSEPDEDGWPTRDLTSSPIWFGAPALPEQIDAAQVAAELAQASVDGALPFGSARVSAALVEPVQLADAEALHRHAARLVLRYAPSEQDLANGKLVGER